MSSDDQGISPRDYFAAKAPITYEVALRVWGDDQPDLFEDKTRESFFAVWTMLRYEWADAMLAEREKGGAE